MASRRTFSAPYAFVVGIMLACLLVVCQAEPGKALTDTDISTATITLTTSFTGAELRQIADGESIDLDRLSEARRDQLLSGIDVAIGDGYRFWKQSLPESAKVVVWIAPEFFLTFKGDDFGPDKMLTLPLSRLVAGMKPRSIPEEAAGTPANPLPDPPSLSEVMAQAPAEPEARRVWSREKALELLTPIGIEWITRAGVLLPHSLFTQPREVAIKDLTADQKAWLKAFYSRYAADTYAKQELLRKFLEMKAKSGEPVKEPFAVGDGTVSVSSGEVPDYPPPFWDQFADKTVISMSVNYLPSVGVPSGASCPKGLRWCVK